jgi:hypothetical protein
MAKGEEHPVILNLYDCQRLWIYKRNKFDFRKIFYFFPPVALEWLALIHVLVFNQ